MLAINAINARQRPLESGETDDVRRSRPQLDHCRNVGKIVGDALGNLQRLPPRLTAE
jgi:hypothetical protein